MQSNFQFHREVDYYTTANESTRLTRIESELEMFRTRVILQRFLFPAPASVLDVGGGPTAHSFWLASQQYEVHLVDIVSMHIEQARAADEKSQS